MEVYLQNAVGMPHGYYEYGFGTSTGQDFLEDSIRDMIHDGRIAKAAHICLDYIDHIIHK